MQTYLKRHKTWIYIGAALVAAVLLTVGTVLTTRAKRPSPPRARDYRDIAASDTLRATIEYNSISYFMKGDTVAGFNYELLQAFAKDHGLQLAIHPEMAFDKCMQALAEGKCDIIASGILATSELRDSLLLTVPIALSRQVLVQRKPSPTQDTLYIESLLDLAGKTVHIVKDSPCALRIRNLGDEIGDTIYIREVEKYGAEQLIALVAHGDIDYAVCEESIAEALLDSMPQIDIHTPIGFHQFYSWAVSKQSPALLDTLNVWINSFKQTKAYRQIYRRYYK